MITKYKSVGQHEVRTFKASEVMRWGVHMRVGVQGQQTKTADRLMYALIDRRNAPRACFGPQGEKERSSMQNMR